MIKLEYTNKTKPAFERVFLYLMDRLTIKKTKQAFLLFFMISHLITHSQVDKMKFGAKTAANYSTYITSSVFKDISGVGYTGKLGYSVGFFTNFSLGKTFELQPELSFASQGTRFVNSLNFEDGQKNKYVFEISESTIILPLIIKFYLTESFSLQAGPQFGLILNRNRKDIKGVPIFMGEDDDYDTFDVGLSTGIGYKFSQNISLSSRYFLGFINKDNFNKSSVLDLGIEYSF